MMKYYIVDYDYQTGEYGIPKQKLVQGYMIQTIDEILDSYFSDFFGEGTSKDQDYARYFDKYGEQVIKINSWREVPFDDALVLKKYLS